MTYISREAAIETAFDYRVDVIENEYDKGYQTAVVDIAKGLNALPAADVKPIVCGEWIAEKDRFYHWHCSQCGYVVGPIKMDCKFCPNCGADMRGSENGL